MENEIYIVGDYISGIAKRPDLANHTCVLIYKENEFLLSFAPNGKVEQFSISYNIIDDITFRKRVIVSEQKVEIKDTKVERDVLAVALLGPTGLIANNMPGLKKAFADDNTHGKMDYNELYELIIKYHTAEDTRNLIINVHEDPKEFIEHFNIVK